MEGLSYTAMRDDELTFHQLAALYVAQHNRYHRGEQDGQNEPAALSIWEELIVGDPERAWPVFVEIVRLQSDDEILRQVGYRLGILLQRHYDAFRARAEGLVRATPRFARIVGDGFFDPESYRERPLDIDKLIDAHEVMGEAARDAHRAARLAREDPERALPIAIEIIHRGPARGFSSYDTFEILQDLLIAHGETVIDRVDAIARQSYLVRRALWRMQPRQLGAPVPYRINDVIWPRVFAATAGTSDFTDDAGPQPDPQTLSEEDERLIDAWFTYEDNFWAFDAMSGLLSKQPEEAWQVLLRMLARSSEDRIGSLAAGPLEDLLSGYGPQLIDRIAAEARTNEKLRQALQGVWISSAEVYPRYLEVMRELGLLEET
jgi:hypothetical protein